MCPMGDECAPWGMRRGGCTIEADKCYSSVLDYLTLIHTRGNYVEQCPTKSPLLSNFSGKSNARIEMYG